MTSWHWDTLVFCQNSVAYPQRFWLNVQSPANDGTVAMETLIAPPLFQGSRDGSLVSAAGRGWLGLLQKEVGRRPF